MKVLKDDINVILAGEAGQGIETAVYILLNTLKEMGYYVFSAMEYQSRVRGGTNAALIRISNKNKPAYSARIDVLIPLDKKVLDYLSDRISDETVIFGDIQNIKQINILNNTLAIGLILGLLKEDINTCVEIIKNYFVNENIIEKNINSLKLGFDKASEAKDLELTVEKDINVKDKLLISGSDALALGCIAGGCNFISSYPMSPSTALFTYLTQNEQVISEQSEDEICAINMGLGAWYAGARAMVSTSGGGFALMTEAVSLCAMIESPMVIHIAQRPGPATGLPTRTEQGDLELALYAGHGEFARIILAPTNPNDAYILGHSAFELADKFQVPVFILTDQYFIDSTSICTSFETLEPSKDYFIRTSRDYKRYALSENPISPRGIPNFGEGLVCVDSDEHDEIGLICETPANKITMTDKRLKKLNLIKNEAISPRLIGSNDYKFLVISWGSTCDTVVEAILGRDGFALLCFNWIYPLHFCVKDYLTRAEKIIIVENNATGQFAKLIKLETGINIELKCLKYDGMPFSVEKLKEYFDGLQ